MLYFLTERWCISSEKTGPQKKQPLTWHTAFYDAIRLELYQYRDVLSFEFEHPLNAEPLRIDVVIIKKEKKAVIEKPIGALFRGVNLVEYKSPQDYLGTDDFHKVGAYARLYSVLNHIEITDITVSFVEEAHPRKLIEYLRELYRYEVREKWPGIYYVYGDILPVQIIESKRLREKDDIWLRDLTRGLDAERLRGIIEKSKGMPKGAPLSAYMYTLLQANVAELREVLAMSDVTIDEVLEEFGFTAKWEAKGREEGREEVARNALAKGLPLDTIGEITGLDIEAIKGFASQ